MRTNYVAVITVLLCLFSINLKSFSQDGESFTEMRKFGMGLHVEQFKLYELNTNLNTSPANKLMFTISPTNHFRIEPEFGIVSYKDKETDLSDFGFFAGVGGFGMFQKGKTNFYMGMRIEGALITSDYEDWNTGDKETETTNRLALAPTMGFEYFFGKHFSFGGEISLKYMMLNSKNPQYQDEDQKQNMLSTDTGLLLRCYF